MTASLPPRAHPPQAFVSSYAPRLRTCLNTLLTPVQPATVLPSVRTTKRGTTAINYSEDLENDTLDDSEAPRRLTGLRSLRSVDQTSEKTSQTRLQAKEVYAPIDVQPIWRDWIGKPKRTMIEKQLQIQPNLPLNLVPIRIDLSIAPFQPEPALPRPPNARELGLDEHSAAYRPADMTPEFRVKDYFLWNLHEALMTPDQFAKVFVDELDFPNDRKLVLIQHIAQQIRSQLEDHAAVELHPVFQKPKQLATAGLPAQDGSRQPQQSERTLTPIQSTPSLGLARSGRPNISLQSHPSLLPISSDLPNGLSVTADSLPSTDDNDPDDASRCIISISLNIQNSLFTDKFEWSLQHLPGAPEAFAKQTCADLSLSGEWIPALAHAIYEAVIKLKKDVAENGGSLVGVVGSGINAWGEIENDVAEVHGDGTLAVGEGAGWRFDNEHLGDEWEPRVELLSKEEIEKREGDRERQLRRMRRETAHRASLMPQSTGMTDFSSSFNAGQDDDSQRMGRGERSKRKRRFRSLGPSGRNSPEITSNENAKLSDQERTYWICSHCRVWGSAVWAVRDGPHTPRSLCNVCGIFYEQHKQLPSWSKDLYAHERAVTNTRPEHNASSSNYQQTDSYTPHAYQSSHGDSSYFGMRPSQGRLGSRNNMDPYNNYTSSSNNNSATNYNHSASGGLPEQYAATLRGGGPKMFDDYAVEGEDLDWTKVTDLRERKRLQNIINGRKYRERRVAAEAAEAAARQAGVVGSPAGGDFKESDPNE